MASLPMSTPQSPSHKHRPPHPRTHPEPGGGGSGVSISGASRSYSVGARYATRIPPPCQNASSACIVKAAQSIPPRAIAAASWPCPAATRASSRELARSSAAATPGTSIRLLLRPSIRSAAPRVHTRFCPPLPFRLPPPPPPPPPFLLPPPFPTPTLPPFPFPPPPPPPFSSSRLPTSDGGRPSGSRYAPLPDGPGSKPK